jgi:tetratricopeptide (TPR) repeat protein
MKSGREGWPRAARWLRTLFVIAGSLLVPCAVIATDGDTFAVSGAKLFNAGNACLRAGRIGEAILNYERASLLAPQDPDIAANLKLARSKAGLWNVEPPALERLAHKAALQTWATIAATALATIAASLPLALVVPLGRPLWLSLRAAAGLALAIALAAIVIGWSDLNRAVTIAKEAVAHVAPAPAAGTVFHLREGEAVLISRALGDFLLVRDRDGQQGWVKAGEVAPIVPGRHAAFALAHD